MADIKASALIVKFQYAYDNKWGYILGTWHTQWTQALQNAKINYMKTKYGSDWKTAGKGDKQYYNALNGGKWIGHWVTDCSGLFYWAFKELGGYMYHGSNTMWNKYCVNKGDLNKGKRTDGQELKPGTAVFVLKNKTDRSHVGLYIGGGKVIEAAGQTSGVTISDISNSKWAEWGELKGVIFDVGVSFVPAEPEPVISGPTAIVNATRVALRTGPSTNDSIILRVDKGKKVELLNNPEWTQVKYEGKTGYMMTKFLDKEE